MGKNLLFCVNDPGFFISHRLDVAKGAKKSGYVVHVATSHGTATEEIKKNGFYFHELPMSRSGRNVFSEMRSFFCILRLLWIIKPKILHLVTIKPVLYGGVCARLSPVKGVVAAVSGMGYIFTAQGILASLSRCLVRFVYALALGKNNLRVIFQNPDDRAMFISRHLMDKRKAVLIRGSGVSLSRYSYFPELECSPVIVFAARLLKDKGVVEFVEAVRILQSRGVSARFQMVGDIDIGNPTSVTDVELDEWKKEGVVEYLGFRSDIEKLFALSHIVVLPSYREGLPKVLIEAAACGRPVVTTDVPGCRDAIEPDVTGLLVPARNSIALAEAMQRLINDSDLRQQMGRAGRALAEREFAVEKVVQRHLDIYEELESNN